MAGLFKRVGNLIKGQVEETIDNMEDPIVVMKQQIAEGIKEYGELNAAHKQALRKIEDAEENVKAQEENIRKYNRIAEAAVDAGNDDDAVAALNKVEQYEALLETAKNTLENAKETESELSITLLEFANAIEKSKVELAEMEGQMAQAEAKEAKNEFSSGFLSDGSSTMERAKKKVEARLAAAEAKEGPATGPSVDPLLAKYDTASTNSKLEALKKARGKA